MPPVVGAVGQCIGYLACISTDCIVQLKKSDPLETNTWHSLETTVNCWYTVAPIDSADLTIQKVDDHEREKTYSLVCCRCEPEEYSAQLSPSSGHSLKKRREEKEACALLPTSC